MSRISEIQRGLVGNSHKIIGGRILGVDGDGFVKLALGVFDPILFGFSQCIEPYPAYMDEDLLIIILCKFPSLLHGFIRSLEFSLIGCSQAISRIGL